MKICREIAQLLSQRQLKLVLAESCTGGMASSLLTQVPGISQHFCGSLVVYRYPSKARWLGMSLRKLDQRGAVNAACAQTMALAALKVTPEAQIAAAITGHLGPVGLTAPKKERALDGVAYVAIAFKKSSIQTPQKKTKSYLIVKKVFLDQALPKSLSEKTSAKQGKKSALSKRKQRQRRASLQLLFLVRSVLSRLE